MTRLPTPGGDDGDWGDILNAYLSVSLTNTGALQSSAITQAGGVVVNGGGLVPTNQLGTGTANTTTYLRGDGSWEVPPGSGGSSTLAGDTDVHITGPSNGQVLTYSSGSSLWINQTPVTAGNATTGAPGLVQLAGDLNGSGTSATAPKVNFSNDTLHLPLTGGTLTGKLTVPSFQVTGGSPVSGKVLTSDSSGNASWSPSTPGVVVGLGSVSGTVACDLSAGIAFTATLTGDTTFQFTNWPAGLVEPEIYTVQDSTGGHAITISGVTWEPTGSLPTFSTSPNAINIIPVASYNGGTNVYGLTGVQGPTGATGAAGPGICTFSMPGTVSVTTGQSRQYFEAAYTLLTVRASVGTAPVGSSLTVDVIKNGGSSILSSPLSIPANSNTATTTSFASSISTSDYLTVNVTAVGSTTAGSDLTVTVTVH